MNSVQYKIENDVPLGNEIKEGQLTEYQQSCPLL